MEEIIYIENEYGQLGYIDPETGEEMWI